MAIQLNANHFITSFEPQRANNGVLFIQDLIEIDGWQAEDDPVALALESFPIPKENNAVVEARFQNERRKFAGPANVEDMEIVVKDVVTKPVAYALFAWRRRVYTPVAGQADSQLAAAGAVGLASQYKRSGTVLLYGPDGSPAESQGVQRRWRLEGLWPTSFDPGDIDMTSEDMVRLTLTLSVDRIAEETNIKGDFDPFPVAVTGG